MDIFKFNGSGSSLFKNGELIPTRARVMWVERYREPGEVEITAKVSSGLHDILAPGTFVSHTKTREVMRIDTYEIASTEDSGDDEVTISGKSADAIIGYKELGASRDFSTVPQPPGPYVLAPGMVSTQVENLITWHCVDLAVGADANDVLPNLSVADVSTVFGPTVEARELELANLHEVVMELLEIDDLGIRTVRPSQGTDLIFEIHSGADVSNSVSFSHEHGDLKSAKYLKSDRLDKNAALVKSTWLHRPYTLGRDGYDRRWITVDARDLDEDLETAPTGAALTNLENLMDARAHQVLSTKNVLEILAAAPRANSRHTYREDYNIGDIVAVNGRYNTLATMRVTEHVEILDEDGFESYPTLSLDQRQNLYGGF